MHLSVKNAQSLDENDAPVNPDQSPADILVLSFTDSDLACMAEAYKRDNATSLLLTSLAPLKHPLSIDLYIEQVAQHAKIILVRLLGGYDWWRYGVDELAHMAREKNIPLILVPGCTPDPRLTKLSTAPQQIITAIDTCLAQGGTHNAAQVLTCLQDLLNGKTTVPTPIKTENGALYRTNSLTTCNSQLATALILFYRAHALAADTAPIDALLESLAARGITARAFMVTSLKDPLALAALHADLASHAPDILIDATAFSAGSNAHPLADAGVPILQVALANTSTQAWNESKRGLSTTDLAMHVVLPEADGRIFTRAISFKEETGTDDGTQHNRVTHTPEPTRIDYVADLATAWIHLAKTPAPNRRIALILSDYPDRTGRSAYAVGLDGPQSATEILQLLANHHYTVIPSVAERSSFRGVRSLGYARNDNTYSLQSYLTRFHSLPLAQQSELTAAWGAPESDPFFRDHAFHLPCTLHGNITVALQPDRGSKQDRKSGYHDATTPPRHGYLAFYWWLRDTQQIDALIHLGTHGNLEWLPGKSVALSESCWPEIVLGATPVIYPYIVSDPGEAAQAKRRISAVTMSHMTPPLMPVSLSPELAELETLVDEFSSADGLDARRMKLLREEILHRARRIGLPGTDSNDEATLLTSLESHLCDIKEQRVGDGLHIFGHDAPNETRNLLAALDGKFIMPGPGGSPVRGRLDIFPTGRNMVTMDPRMIPTKTASTIGKRGAEEFIRRYMQDHGDYPKRVVIDLWGSATLRNGGDEIAQALYLMGVECIWDDASHRVSGFTLIDTEWPRVDVSLKISGLFRDMFSNLITLFDDAAKAVAQLENWKPEARIFGAAPGTYGSGVNPLIDNGRWTQRGELGQAYLDASQFAYGRDEDGIANPTALKSRIASADALIHIQDQREMDVLSGADFADAEGGFAAAATLLGADPSLYHLDTSRPEHIKARTLAEEISLTLQARALNADWIAGQMRHGYAGAASFADAVDQLFAFAATTNSVAPAQFDGIFDAYVHDENVREFMARENPDALQAIVDRLREAINRGMWNPLRNSVWTQLDILKEAA